MMDTNKKILMGVASATVVIGDVVIGLTLSQVPEKADPSTIHTEATTESPKKTLPPTTEAETEIAAPMESGDASNVTAEVKTHTSGRVFIQYPAVNKMGDTDKQAKVNELLKLNALSVIEINEIGESKDTLPIKCKIISVDRKRITTTCMGGLMGDGAAHPVNSFYSNAINLPQVQDLGLEDFIGVYTTAGYVLSDDVKFSGISADVGATVLEHRSSPSIDILTAVFGDADFPLSLGTT